MEAIVLALCPILRWIVLKKDSDLPLVVRLARWVALAFASAYAFLVLAQKYCEVF